MNAVVSIEQDGDLQYLPVSNISPSTGNPRKFFDPKAHEELTASIREQGVIQPIVVRPVSDREGYFEIIAGERRWRAAQSAGLEDIPAVIRRVDQRVALAMATAENLVRDDMSAAEEAWAARDMTDLCEGDKGEAAKRLGWTESKLESRLMLLHATEAVMTALAERKIKLGHAELLSTLPSAMQDGTLAKVVGNGVSVADLKQRMAGIAMQLSAAIFDTATCNGCPHNSDTQVAMFSESVGNGQCSNRECFGQKTKSALDAKKTALAEDYNVVFLDVEKAPGSWTYLIKDGSNGVGPDQFTACGGCAKFGAIIVSEPGAEGQIKEDICFDVGCNAKMMSAWKAKIQAEKSNTTDAKSTAKGKAGKKSAKGKANGKSSTTTVAASPKRVTELARKFLREQASEVATRNPTTILAHMVYCTLESANMLKEVGLKGSGDRADVIAKLHAMSDEELESLAQKATLHLIRESTYCHGSSEQCLTDAAIQVVVCTGHDLTGRYTLTNEFLEAHTKAGVEALMQEATNPDGITFAQWMEAKEAKSFKKLMTGKSKDIIDAILTSGFDFSQWVPSCILAEVDKLSKSGNAAKE